MNQELEITYSALRLERLFLKEAQFILNPGFENIVAPASPGQIEIPELSVTAQVAEVENSPRLFGCFLTIELHEDPKRLFPYRFRVSIGGDFYVHESVPDNKARMFAYSNGASVLYSTARDLIMGMTGRGSYAPFILQTMSFIPVNTSDLKSERTQVGSTTPNHKSPGKGKGKKVAKISAGIRRK